MTIGGDWTPSCLASSIEYLVCLAGPARTASPPPEDQKILAIPKEIWRLVDFLFRQGGLDYPDLFTSPSPASEIAAVLDDLDENVPWRAGGHALPAVAGALLRLLASLARPVVPVQHCKAFRSHPDPIAYCKQCLLEIPLPNYNVLVYLVAFLREMLSRSSSTESQTRDLCRFSSF